MDAAAAAASTVGVTPAATRSRAAATRASRVRAFWAERPPVSYGVDMTFMVCDSLHGTHVPRTGGGAHPAAPAPRLRRDDDRAGGRDPHVAARRSTGTPASRSRTVTAGAPVPGRWT